MIMTRNAYAVKEGLQSYCEKVYSYSNIIQIWMLKNSKEPLVTVISRILLKIASIRTFDFSTLDTTIPCEM